MTVADEGLAGRGAGGPTAVPAGVQAPTAVEPASTEEIVELVRASATEGSTVLPIGGGSTFADLPSPPASIAVSTASMAGIVAYEPDDLTVVVLAGTRLADLDRATAQHHQSAVLPESSGHRTVGGVVADGASGFRRLRYGPTRDRVLGLGLVTGYGRAVRGGGPLVKNVTGYDLPRLATGSRGSLGVITEVCLKLWPVRRETRTVPVDDPRAALARVHRPLAVLQTESGSFAYLEGSASAVASAVDALGSAGEEGLAWPDPDDQPYRVSMRVPARALDRAIAVAVEHGARRFVAQHGVGRLDAGFATASHGQVGAMRAALRDVGGVAVVERWPHDDVPPDRWGTAPDGSAIQRRLLDLFDPAGVFPSGLVAGDAR